MKSSDLALYEKRKNGKGMGFYYKASAFSPAILILLVSFILNFAIIFIISMSEGIENILINLGSGNIKIEGHYDGPIDGELYYVREASALAFSENGTSPLYIKGVDYDLYFTPIRRDLLHLAAFSGDEFNPAVISKRLSENLGVSEGDRFSIMLYDENLERARPLLLSVAAIFSSGYAEFDSLLCYIPLESLRDEMESTEIVLNNSEDEISIITNLRIEGFNASSYKDIYSGIYSNVELSISVLYAVFLTLALLASFFSSNISLNYIDRDKKDIALLFLEGLSLKEIRRLYSRITIKMVLFAILSGLFLSLLFSFFTPSILSYLSRASFPALDAYLLSFDIVIPVLPLIAINILLILFSYISLSISLRHLKGISIKDLLST